MCELSQALIAAILNKLYDVHVYAMYIIAMPMCMQCRICTSVCIDTATVRRYTHVYIKCTCMCV